MLTREVAVGVGSSEVVDEAEDDADADVLVGLRFVSTSCEFNLTGEPG